MARVRVRMGLREKGVEPDAIDQALDATETDWIQAAREARRRKFGLGAAGRPAANVQNRHASSNIAGFLPTRSGPPWARADPKTTHKTTPTHDQHDAPAPRNS